MRVPGLPGDPLWLLGVPDVRILTRGGGTALTKPRARARQVRSQDKDLQPLPGVDQPKYWNLPNPNCSRCT